MPKQDHDALPLFAWADQPPPRAPARSGDFRIWHPCACGSTHSMVWLSHPVSMIGLRHWQISKIEAWRRSA